MKKLRPREVKYVAQDHTVTQDHTASRKLRDLTQEWVGGEVRRNERDEKNKREKEKKKKSVITVYTKDVILKIERYILSLILFQNLSLCLFCLRFWFHMIDLVEEKRPLSSSGLHSMN